MKNLQWIFSFGIIFVLFQACSDRPPRAKFPGPPGRTSEFETAQKSKEVKGGFDSFGRALGDSQAEKSIRGIVRLDPSVSLPQKKYFIFLSARPVTGGPPLAVKKLAPKDFPFRFSITERDVMMEGTSFEGYVELTLRIDQVEDSGRSDPLSRLPGDLFGKLRVKVGNQKVNLMIKEKI